VKKLTLPELNYIRPETLEEALAFLAEHPTGTRIVAGGTDLVIELRKEGSHGQTSQPTAGTAADGGLTVEPGGKPLRLLDLSAIESLSGFGEQDGKVVIGALTPHAVLAASLWLEQRAVLLQRAAASIGSVQIRNRGTVGGNLVNAAPCADLVAPLVALGAKARLRSLKDEREVPVEKFITGPYQTEARPEEILTEIVFDVLPKDASSSYVRLGRREALTIMRLSIAVILIRNGQGRVEECRIVPGAATPTTHRIPKAESLLLGKCVDESLAAEAGAVVSSEVIREVGRRWSTPYKEPVIAALCRRAILRAAGLETIQGGETSLHRTQREDSPHAAPGGGEFPRIKSEPSAGEAIPVRLVVNGQPREVVTAANRTLVEVLREDLYLTGTKVGCEVGECGACTVLMDGRAVNSCLVLIGQADGRSIVTIEGLAEDGQLHPLQEAFLEEMAVQCGFCTPGMILSAKALLDAKPEATREEIVTAISGNLCRCTGYEQIVRAIESAAEKMARLRSVGGSRHR